MARRCRRGGVTGATGLPTPADAGQAWSQMPHTARWTPSDWHYAADGLELVVRASAEDAAVSLWTELRAREKAMATTFDARQGLRLRYVVPVEDTGDGSITSIDDYRNL
jgi:hypothetical protein